ncbi:MAG TPA: NnrS family protein [Candidatus Competibacteraceae bacterium]|nr:NnrS family protein [Candidatus Competibacteraceae bacterium]
MSLPRRSSSVLLDYGFRPFFLLAGGYAVLVLVLWLGRLAGADWPGAPRNPLAWHVHEMLLGFIGAAIGGFLLTAVPNWTGRAPLTGTPLAALVLTWLAGRLAMAFSGALPAWLVAALDLPYLIALAMRTVGELRKAGNKGQYPLVAILGLLILSNTLFHLASAGALALSPLTPLYLILHLVVALVVLIGGRIIPAFTRNWMSAKGLKPLPVSRPPVEIAAAALTVATGLADGVFPGSAASGVLALAAAAAHGLRLSGWRGLATRREGLLAVLHLGYAWLVLGYVLLGLAALGLGASRSGALHVLTIGCLGTMVIAVMSRAALGHTGRKLHADRPLLLAYLLVSLGAAARLAAALAPAHYWIWLGLAGLAWSAGFGLFFLRFWPILTRPRVDVVDCHAPR